MEQFGNLFQNVTSSLSSAIASHAISAVSRATDHFTVSEITGKASIDEVAQYPVKTRATQLLLYGPVTTGRFTTSPLRYHIILHAPDSQKMFRMLRTDNEQEAEETFVLYKECFPSIVQCDPTVCDAGKLDSLARMLRENRGWSASHLAAAAGLLKVLGHEKMKNSLNEQEGTHLRTPLLIAVEQGNGAVVSLLLDKGADPTITDIKGNTVFHVGANKSGQICRLLIEKLPMRYQDILNKLNTEGYTPLHSACKANNPELVQALLTAGARPDVLSPQQGLAISSAIKANSLLCAKFLMDQNPTLLSQKGLQDAESPLHWASGPETITFLLERGCDPNAVDAQGYTPLHNAVKRGCLKSTLNLLCQKAYPNLKGGDKEDAPIHIATRQCSLLLMKALVCFGADVNITNKDGHTPRHLVDTVTNRPDNERREALFVLSAVGAFRCPPGTNDCKEGCHAEGNDNGRPPLNFPTYGIVKLMDDALNAFSLQKSATDGQTQSEEGGRLLCLDGGGIRGVILTQILVVIQEELGIAISDLFDWVAGTSTGGILALSLACGKSPLETQCLYMRLKDKVFGGNRPYSATVMENFLKTEFGSEKTMGDITNLKVMIMTALVDRRPADLHIFRNYISPQVLLGESDACPQEYSTQFVWEAAKVTGAAPSYFQLDHEKFIDGGLISNNPTLDAMTEIHQYFVALRSLGMGDGKGRVLTSVVTLGTGIPPLKESNASLLNVTWPTGVMDAIHKVPRLSSLVNLLIEQATQSEGQVVERSRAWCSSIGVPLFRFSPQMSEDIQLDEKDDEKLVNLLWETRCYMKANKGVILDMKRVLVGN